MKKIVILTLVVFSTIVLYSCKDKKHEFSGIITDEPALCVVCPGYYSASVDTNNDGKPDLFCVNYSKQICDPASFVENLLPMKGKGCIVEDGEDRLLIIRIY